MRFWAKICELDMLMKHTRSKYDGTPQEGGLGVYFYNGVSKRERESYIEVDFKIKLLKKRAGKK